MLSYCISCNNVWESNERDDKEHVTISQENGEDCSLDTIGRCVEGSTISAYFNVYELSSEYGGPEEGGWNRTTYSPIASIAVRVVITPRFAEGGDVESGPRVEFDGYEFTPTAENESLVTFLTKHYEDKKKRDRYISYGIELGWAAHHVYPRFYC